MTTTKKRLRGLVNLMVDAVDHGAEAIERVHLGTTKRTFDVLSAVPVVSLPAQGVRAVHDLSVRGTYGAVRLVTRAVGVALGAAVELVDDAPEAGEPVAAAEPPPGPVS